MSNNVRITGLAGLLVTNLAIVFGRFFIATKAPAYIAAFHGFTPSVILAFLFNWLLSQLALSGGGWNMIRLDLTIAAFTLAAVLTGIDVYIVQNLLI